MNCNKIKIFKGYWNINDVTTRPDCLFIYGDNDIGYGKGGQAIIRDLPNAIGIPTKKHPSNHPSSFYTDNEYEANKFKITSAILNIISKSKNYKYVVLPEDGIGTGLADLPQKAPKTYIFLSDSINKMRQNIQKKLKN